MNEKQKYLYHVKEKKKPFIVSFKTAGKERDFVN